MASLDTIQESGLPIRNRKGNPQFIHPLDLEQAVGSGVGLPLTSGTGGEYPSITSGSASEIPLEQQDQTLSTTRKSGGVFTLNFTTQAQVKDNIRNLVLTSPGERPYHPNFGVGVYELLFDNATDDVLALIEERIGGQIEYWLPYVKLHEAFVSRAENNPNRVNIGVTYSAYNNIDKEVVDILV